MAGIDKIIFQIEEDTRAVCDKVISAAQLKADGIIAEAEDKAAKILSDGKASTDARVADIAKRGDSAAVLEARKTLLYTKQDIITTMLSKGIEEVKSLPDEAYFDLIYVMIKNNMSEKIGKIYFGKKDLDRLPTDFDTKLRDVSDGKLSLVEEPVSIDAGFILKYGGIEENCSFDAIFAGKDEMIKDRAGKLLF